MTTNDKAHAIAHIKKMLRRASCCRDEARQYVVDLKYFNELQVKRGASPILVETIDKQNAVAAEMDRLIEQLQSHLTTRQGATP